MASACRVQQSLAQPSNPSRASTTTSACRSRPCHPSPHLSPMNSCSAALASLANPATLRGRGRDHSPGSAGHLQARARAPGCSLVVEGGSHFGVGARVERLASSHHECSPADKRLSAMAPARGCAPNGLPTLGKFERGGAAAHPAKSELFERTRLITVRNSMSLGGTTKKSTMPAAAAANAEGETARGSLQFCADLVGQAKQRRLKDSSSSSRSSQPRVLKPSSRRTVDEELPFEFSREVSGGVVPLPSDSLVTCGCPICSRRGAIMKAAAMLAGSSAAIAAATVLPPAWSARAADVDMARAEALLKSWQGRRWQWQEELFASAMANTMEEYEARVKDYKAALFSELCEFVRSRGNGREGADGARAHSVEVVELGVGTGPNLSLYGSLASPSSLSPTSNEANPPPSSSSPSSSLPTTSLVFLPSSAPTLQTKFHITGVDPNAAMAKYAVAAASEAGLQQSQFSFVQGVGEALPLPDSSADVVVGTLVLCSVTDVSQTVSEVLRVLRPGGAYFFIEHVAAPDGSSLRLWQQVLDPLQQAVADGCHLTRNPLPSMESVGFASVDARRVMVDGLSLLSPHLVGKAVKGA